MNINEIAKMAGVSRATVSRYLNEGYVSEEKRQAIKKVIEETGYQPSAQAQMLRTRKTRLVGVIIPKINSESISRMVSGISLVLSKEGFQLLLANTENDEKEELKYLEIFKENHVDGIILLGTIFTKEHKSLFKKLQVPMVLLGQKLEGYSCVYHDNYHGIKAVAELLLEKSKYPVYLGVTELDEAAGAERKRGFLAALKESGRTDEEAGMFQTGFNIEDGYRAAAEIMEKYPFTDAVCCATDSLALGVITKLNELGKKIPGEIQVTGIGDSKLSMVSFPPLTTVHLYYKTSGMEAANMLVEMMRSGEEICKEVKIGYKVVEKGSTVL